MSKGSAEILDEFADRYPDCDWRFRAGRMAEEIEILRAGAYLIADMSRSTRSFTAIAGAACRTAQKMLEETAALRTQAKED